MLALNRTSISIGLMVMALLASSTACYYSSPAAVKWSDSELAMLRSLRLPQKWEIRDPSNAYLQNPQAALLGKLLFSDLGLSRSGQIACASCHHPEHYFTQPSDLANKQDKQVPSLLGAASFSWFMLDGSADSLWAQALMPLENHLEHGGTRTQYVQHVLRQYPDLYQEVFGQQPAVLANIALPAQASPNSQSADERRHWNQLSSPTRTSINRVFANIGKSLAAYQATLWPKETRFDRYIDQVTAQPGAAISAEKTILSHKEIAGLKIFISEQGQCLRCHNGALLSNGSFHATTVPRPHPAAQLGRQAGIQKALTDPFNCLGEYSDSSPAACRELIFSKRDGYELKGATKVPSLRNIAKTAPYMHAGQFDTLNEVLNYYNRAAIPLGTHSDLNVLALLPYQLNQLEAFLLTLTEDEINQPAK